MTAKPLSPTLISKMTALIYNCVYHSTIIINILTATIFYLSLGVTIIIVVGKWSDNYSKTALHHPLSHIIVLIFHDQFCK